MRSVNIPAYVGVGFLATGAVFSVKDLMLFDSSYVLLAGPMLWIVGSALMVAWAVGRVALALDHHPASPDRRVPTARGPSITRSAEGSSKAAAVRCDTRAGT